MKKSKVISRRIISFFLVLLAATFVCMLFVLHICFPTKYSQTIRSASIKYRIDADLICAVIWTESKYRVDAVSQKGAIGLMQIMPSTASYIAPKAGLGSIDSEMLYNEITNIELGSCYLRYLFDKFNDEQTVLAAYNAGEGKVLEWQARGEKTIPYKETRDYIQRVAIVKRIYRFKAK